MVGLPTGTVTFLFTDIENSTRLLHQLKEAYADVLAECRGLLRKAMEEPGGHEVDTQGDALFAVFPSARAAVLAALAAQRQITRHPWPSGISVGIRMGLHTGEGRLAETGYVGMDVHRAARIAAAAHGGQLLLSQTTRDLVGDDLPEGLSLRDLGQHTLKDLPRPEHLFQLVAPDLPADFPALRTLYVPLNNLPRQLTSFVGRKREIEEVKGLLPTTALLTLTGPGGCGKTRLAFQVAAGVLTQYPDGVWMAELTPLSDPGLVPKTVASALGVPEQPGRPLVDTLQDALRRKSLLLVLDNCEHLIDACGNLADDLLRGCAGLRILATSQRPLGIPGERVWTVPSLSVPEAGSAPRQEDVAEFDGIRLFVERAAASKAGFALSASNADAVAQLCRRVDGIPLAIELAAARVRVLTVQQILDRLDDRFGLLTGSGRAAVPRHQTLRATMDWSYGLLSGPEQILCRRLSVFAGGWTLQAAETVCAPGGVAAGDVLDLLTLLADKSLVVADTQRRESRYRFLETVRQYAWERLVESNEADEVRGRHLDWCLKLVEEIDPKLRGPEQVRWLDRLEDEHDNLRAALDLCGEERPGMDYAARLAAGLRWFWSFRGHFREGRARLEAVLQRGPNPDLQIKVIAALLPLLNHQEHTSAIALAESGLALCQQQGDLENKAWLSAELAEAAARHGQYERAAELASECLNLGRGLGGDLLISTGFSILGFVSLQQRRADAAAGYYKKALAFAKTRGEPRSIAMTVGNLGFAALDQGDARGAAEYFTDALQRTKELADPYMLAQLFWGFASVAVAQAQYARAVRLLAVAETSREAIGYERTPLRRGQYQQRVLATHTALGQDAFEAAWAEGRAMTRGQAIEYALAEA